MVQYIKKFNVKKGLEKRKNRSENRESKKSKLVTICNVDEIIVIYLK